MKIVVLMLFLNISTVSAQVIEPPTTSDEFGWLRWAVIVLLGILISGSGVFFAFMKSSHVSRIEDKDSEIERLIALNLAQNLSLEKMQADKDALNKDMQEKVIPALTSSADLIRTFLQTAKQ